MKVNYDQKYANPNKTTTGVRNSAEDSSLKVYYQVQGHSRLKVH